MSGRVDLVIVENSAGCIIIFSLGILSEFVPLEYLGDRSECSRTVKWVPYILVFPQNNSTSHVVRDVLRLSFLKKKKSLWRFFPLFWVVALTEKIELRHSPPPAPPRPAQDVLNTFA